MKQVFKKYIRKIKNPLYTRKIKGFLLRLNFLKKQSNSDYSAFQKSFSIIIIFFFLFNIGFRIPFLQFFNYKVNAESKEFYNLVSILVNDAVYNDVEWKLNRYAEDIEKVLDNTKVVIIPTPRDASPFQISSLLESLYFEWYKSIKKVDFESKLIGSLFVWDIPLPVVKIWENYSKTILPYTDFKEKTYVYNHKTWDYEESENWSTDIVPEIWHWVISPNTWDEWDDINAIKDYFDKNHDFYIWDGLFDKNLWVISWLKCEWEWCDELENWTILEIDENWNPITTNNTYEPFVFYFDQFREEQSINYTNYKWYQARQENLEDLVYNRYSRDLAAKLKNQILNWQQEDLNDLLRKIFPEETLNSILSWSTISWNLFGTTSDISTRYATNKLVKRFIEIFNSSILSEMRQNVYNAWRYSQTQDKVNADLIPFLISVIDLISEEVVKNANDDLETKIDDLVKNGLSRKIPIFTSVVNNSLCTWYTYTNYFYGKKWDDITSAEECSIYRWSLTNSWTLVEANRWYNVSNASNDSSVISSCSKSSIKSCKSNMSCLTRWWWAGNSPINLNIWPTTNTVDISLNNHNLSWSIVPLFDVWWAKRESNILNTNSPLDCLEWVWIKTEEFWIVWEWCDKVYSIPEKLAWWCNTDNLAKWTVNYNDIKSVVNWVKWAYSCPIKSVNLDWRNLVQGWFFWDECIELEEYNYKSIPSYVFHKSPIPEYLETQINNMTSPALPIDKDRYVDFIWADWNYKKINYPYLFRLNIASWSKNTLESSDVVLKNYLDIKSNEINSLIESSWPKQWDEMYNYLKTWIYPDSNFDLYDYFKSKDIKTFTLNWDSKDVNYYDTLVFALYWKNLNSVSAKYKFVFENYLSDQFTWNSYNFWLPKNKKMYEVAYLWAPWDAENMYIKMDPESKNINPYADIMWDNASLYNMLLWLNVWDDKNEEKLFKCWPPDWVPIWEWIPAIMCRLKSMLPPTIKIWWWDCWNQSLFMSEDEQEELAACDWDIDKNGINDCLESELESWYLDFTSDASRYYYNRNWKLKVQLVDKDWNPIRYDNATVVNFEIDSLSLSDWTLIYKKWVSNENAKKEAYNYLWFKDGYVKVSVWEANYAFSTKNKDIDVRFKAYIDIVDFKKNSQIYLENFIDVEVRWDNFIASSYNINNENSVVNLDSWSNWIIASDKTSIYIVDWYTNTITSLKNSINNNSSSKDKLVFLLENFSKSWWKLPINYPLNYDLIDSNWKSYSSWIINSIWNFKDIWSLLKSWNYSFEIKDKYWFKFKKNFVVKPDIAKSAEITLGTSVLETWWSITTHFLTIYDQFKNPVNWEFFTIDWKITSSWFWTSWVVFAENSDDSISYQTLEWFKAFRLKSTDNEKTNTIKFDIKDSTWNKILSASKEVKTISDVALAVSNVQWIKVWWWEYKFIFSVRDKNGSIIDDFNSRLYLTINSIYWTPTKSYVDVTNWKWEVSFITKKTASKDVKLSFQVEWLKKIYTKYIDILPDAPIRIDLSLTRDKIEASENDYTYLKAELKDRYSNLVYSDNTTNLSLEVLDQYKSIIKPEYTSSLVKDWIATFKIKATDTPWIAYIKVKANPEFKTVLELEWQSPFLKNSLFFPFVDSAWLTETWKKFFVEYDIDYYRSKFYNLEDLKNSYDFTNLSSNNQKKLVELWLKTNKITINPQSENAIKMETFYFWNKESIQWNSYNSLYSVLLWAPYWDITKKDYLASSMLFDKDNRSLVVTSILNDPYRHNDVISISWNWSVKNIVDWKNITQDIKYISNINKEWKLYFDIYNDSLWVQVWKIYYDLDNSELGQCYSDKYDFSNCTSSLSKSKTSILLKSNNKTYYTEDKWGALILKDSSWKEIFKVNKDWTIEKSTSISIENYAINDTKMANFAIKEWNNIVWLLWYNLVNSTLNTTRDESLIDSKLNNLENAILVYLNSYLYGERLIDSWKDDILMIYYNDPFDDVESLDDFSSTNSSSFENFKENKWVWWEWKNKALLLFWWGESVWESTKKYASFSMINLWDPVVSLKSIKKKLPWTNVDRSFDSTLWTLLSRDNRNSSYKTFDYNNDNFTDIALVKSNWYIELLENRWWKKFDNMWNLVYLPELWSKPNVEAWDFTWDGYHDIFYVANWEPYLLNNVEKNFTKISLKEQFNLSWSIVRTSSFDMDNDDVKDIVTLDTSWEINILYWKIWTSKNPEFTKKFVWDWYVLKLDSSVKEWNWAIYYSWIPTFDEENIEDLILSNEELIQELQNAWTWAVDSFKIDEKLIDSLLFVRIPYSTGAVNILSSWSTMTEEDILNMDIPMPNNEELWDFGNDTVDWITDLLNYSYDNIYYYQSDDNEQDTVFVKSDYSKHFWLEVKKIFTDINWWNLNAWDIVNVSVEIENVSNTTKTWVAYAENIEDYFYFDFSWNNIQTSKSWSLIKYNVWNFDFLLDNIRINSWDKFEFEYQVETLPLSYWYIETWLFEKWEIWDDTYWDIMLKPDDKSCVIDVDLYRSTWTRSYDKWKKEASCNADKLILPWDLELNKIDENWNWVPDYIDNLVDSALNEDSSDFQEFWSWSISDLFKDTDWDWIPDDEDSTPSYNNNSQDTWNFLDAINDTTDEIIDWIDFISQWLCKWFGWGSCLALPLNAAPLAPGSSITAFWFPIMPAYPSIYWVTTSWLPTFSMVTYCPPYSFTRPPCPVWAWWIFGYAPGPFRLFVTPTITWAIWVAACFSDNMATPYGLTPIWVYPFFMQWWNCVVAAKPLIWCEWDWSDWDVNEKNNPINFWNYDVVNWSCVANKKDWASTFRFEDDFVTDYLKYKNWNTSQSIIDSIKETFSTIASESKRQTVNIPPSPLITIWDWNDSWAWSFSIDIDTSALKKWNLKDVIKIQNTWITDFPAFLMDWVDRQIEEIVTKLTSFPSIIVILPDFDWVFDDSWTNFFDKVKESYDNWRQKWLAEDNVVQSQIDSVNNQKESLNCNSKTSSDDWYFDCMVLSLKEQNLWLQKDFKPTQTISWIKWVYEFVWNLPLISIQEQTINVNIPWPTDVTLTKAKVSWEMTKKQRSEEVQRAKESWSLWQACNWDKACEERNAIWEKLILDANWLLNSLDKNIEIIEEYKKLPEKLIGLLNKKEVRLEQILCNVDTLTTLFWWWLGANGERFKAWVQAYILIKAVLKSWQLLIDLFVGYEQSCKECKNERQDLMTFMWSLISAVLPKIPVIQFPKWPNIIIDLHNIKAWLIISLPDFKFNVRPIVLPTLPKLYLPSVPSVKIILPTIPLLPTFEIPELPDLPTLPKIELPDLPPPPKLPKLLWSIEGVLNILKIITMVQCILKFNPLVPERRAWDQIAYITERQWFIPTDFFQISLPQFSFPFIDAIKITSYVNFELEADFITEMARQWVAPLNTFTNDIVNLFKINLPDLDFRSPIYENIDIDLGDKTWMNETKDKVESELINFSKVAAYWVYKLVNYMNDNKDNLLSNKEFLSFVNESISSDSVQKDPKTEELRRLWKDVSDMTYSKEDKIINNLKENNKEKFDTLKTIINTEIEKTKKQKESIKNLSKPNSIKFVSENTSSNIKWYNELLRKHNLEALKATMNLYEDKNKENDDLKKQGSELLARVKWWLWEFSKKLAANTTSTGTSTWTNSCSSDPNYKYDYKGIYVIENGISYRLFDYVEELKWDERLSHMDYDNDEDEDILYMVSWELYLKTNTKNSPNLVSNLWWVESVSISKNKFFNNEVFYEALNNTKESVSKNWFINFSFDAPTRDDLNNFRLEYYTIIDKYLNEWNDSYIPQNIKKELIDSFVWIDDSTIYSNATEYDVRNNVSYLKEVWNWINSDIIMETKELKWIRQDLDSWKIVSLSSNTKLYAWDNPVSIEYYTNDINSPKELTINRYQNVQFKSGAKVKSINWEAYVEWKNIISLSWNNIKEYLWKPLLPGTSIRLVNPDSILTDSSHITVEYYDWSELWIDFRDITKYSIYNLWYKSDSYLISVKQDNDFYYSRIYAFKDWIKWTKSSQVLLSPQLSSDKSSPELNVSWNIKIPVYQSYIYDFTPYIYEDSWIWWIWEFYIDSDLENDSDNDWNKKNDKDTSINIIKNYTTVKAKFWPYNELFTKNIWLHLYDLAWNYLYKEARLEVYSPKPWIDNKEWNKIYWNIDEKLWDEPVNLYRYRWWVLSKLIDTNWNVKVNTSNSWKFEFTADTSTNKWLKLEIDWIDAASVNENTWKITIKNLPWANIKVLSSNSSLNDIWYPKILLMRGIDEVYYEYLSFDNKSNLKVVDSYNNITSNWIYYRNLEQWYYSSYQVPLSASYNPWAIIIYTSSDPNKTPLFTIFTDWRINTYSSYYEIRYDTLWDNVIFKLFDNNRNVNVWELLMKMDNWNYIMK